MLLMTSSEQKQKKKDKRKGEKNMEGWVKMGDPSLGYPEPPSVLALVRSRKKRVWGISSNIPCLAPGMQMLPQILITQSLKPQLLV